MDDNWQKVREIFDQALCRKPEERPKFIVEACGDDQAILHEVESLFSSLNSADDFLETPIAAQVADIISPAAEPLERGTLFNHYEILEQIGAGGMGEVYLARDKRLDRLVAVKILNEKFARQESNLKRFIKEAKAASALNHPNILVIHEIGESKDRHFIVSEYIKGETLRDFLKNHIIQLSEILDISIQIANALTVAHEARLVHRDVKPENIIIRPDGYVKILDFGLAKLVENKKQTFFNAKDSTVGQVQTAKGVILGTVKYMSPEQAKGEPIDERTDIFSLGIVIYEMIAGRTPFAGDSPSETFANLINKEPPPLIRFAGNIPAELERIVLKMLSKNRDERYPSMKEALADLKEQKENLSLDKRLERTIRQKDTATAMLKATTDDAAHTTAATQKVFGGKIKYQNLFAAAFFNILLFGFVGLGYYFSNSNDANSSGRKSIAVLPLKPINTANRDEIYEVGIADSLIQRLGSIKGFVVRPLSAVRKYTDLEQDPLAAGREQQVNYVLASNYQTANGKVRVTSQLLNVETGQIEETYKTEKDAGDVFAMQDAVADEVGKLLLSRFAATSSRPAATRGTDNEEAYRLYLQGMYLADRHTLWASQKAVEFLERAVEFDPAYAQAWAGKAYAHRAVANFIGRSAGTREDYQKSMEAINKALSLDGNLAEAYSTLCENKMYYDYDFAGAESACKRGIDLNHNSPLAHQVYSRYLISRGRFDEAITEIKTTIDLEPASLFYNSLYGVNFYYARRYPEAVAQFKRVLAMDENFGMAYYWLYVTLAAQGNESEAFEIFMKWLEVNKADEATFHAYRAAYQTFGWRGVMQEQAKRFEQGEERYFFGACYNAEAGNKDKAFEYLEKSYQRREMWMAYLQVDPRLYSLRGDPRFEALIKKVEER